MPRFPRPVIAGAGLYSPLTHFIPRRHRACGSSRVLPSKKEIGGARVVGRPQWRPPLARLRVDPAGKGTGARPSWLQFDGYCTVLGPAGDTNEKDGDARDRHSRGRRPPPSAIQVFCRDRDRCPSAPLLAPLPSRPSTSLNHISTWCTGGTRNRAPSLGSLTSPTSYPSPASPGVEWKGTSGRVLTDRKAATHATRVTRAKGAVTTHVVSPPLPPRRPS